MGNFRRRFVLPMNDEDPCVTCTEKKDVPTHTYHAAVSIFGDKDCECLFLCQTLNQGTAECMIDTVEVILGEFSNRHDVYNT